MNRLLCALLTGLTLMFAAPISAQAPPVQGDALVRVILTTSVGPISLDLEAKRAPITTANFLRYVDQKRYDGAIFYRAMKLDWGTQPNGLIQGGVQNDPKRTLKAIAHEPTNMTGVTHVAGTISMARWAPGTAMAEFSILLADMPSLDAHPGAPGDNAGYAAFGHVVEGNDVLAKIFHSPVSLTKGEGVMKGQMIAVPVKILSIRRAVPVAPIKTKRR
jgi:peptidyl-prolyl cis-trans isomerase A (cyclophilin A)